MAKKLFKSVTFFNIFSFVKAAVFLLIYFFKNKMKKKKKKKKKKRKKKRKKKKKTRNKSKMGMRRKNKKRKKKPQLCATFTDLCTIFANGQKSRILRLR